MGKFTHSIITAAAGGTVAGDTNLGNLVLPADGPWKVHNIFGQAVESTPTAAQSLHCSGVIQSVSGDITPNPSPTIFPIISGGASLGATIDQAVCPLAIREVDWTAQGKASVNMFLRQYAANTVAPQALMGMVFGPSVPNPPRTNNYDTVRVAKNAAAESAVGTIIIAQGNHRIVSVCASCTYNGVVVTVEELIGYIRLSSDDVDLAPSMWPFSNVFGSGLGALIMGGSNLTQRPIPCDIPVPGGSRINVTCIFMTALTNAADVTVTLGYN